MKGDLSSCHCSSAARPQSLGADYTWGGCGDNIQYASHFSRKFLDDPRVEKLNGSTDIKLAKKLLMDDHNNEAGRQVLKNVHHSPRIKASHNIVLYSPTISWIWYWQRHQHQVFSVFF